MHGTDTLPANGGVGARAERISCELRPLSAYPLPHWQDASGTRPLKAFESASLQKMRPSVPAVQGMIEAVGFVGARQSEHADILLATRWTIKQ
jgi:hypothetical protein